MFYLIDKKKDVSSFKAIKDFARENNIKKIGHTGTLDPLATGLLLVATDDDTKLIDYVDKGSKEYKATMVLGFTSDTYDSQGTVITNKVAIPPKDIVEKTLMSFLGKSKQIPPNFSAKKINGQRAYKLAREGIDVKLKEVDIEVTSIHSFKDLGNNTYQFNIEVSRGTYIRSIIHDLGQKLICGAIMSELDRVKIGKLTKEDIGKPISIFDIFTLPVLEVNEINDLLNGKIISINSSNGTYGIKYKNDIVGIGTIDDNKLKPNRMFGNKIERL